MGFGEKYTPYYGFIIIKLKFNFRYYTTNDFTIKDFFMNIAVYMFVFDTWFYTTHMMVHHPFLMKHIHSVHHEFIEPSAFG